ncbi:MAG TPA: hypothetical protein VE913_24530 [Longimicrobium sp.]|nr:hypothetical protein [Longimicrobium sp.]
MLPPGRRAVVYRPARESSTIRKPAHKPPTSLIDLPNELNGPNDEENYCSRGWPYNLLVPREDVFPDRKVMGYPFHRAFRSRGIMATAAALPSFAVRAVTIRHLRSDHAEPRYHEAAPE